MKLRKSLSVSLKLVFATSLLRKWGGGGGAIKVLRCGTHTDNHSAQSMNDRVKQNIDTHKIRNNNGSKETFAVKENFIAVTMRVNALPDDILNSQIDSVSNDAISVWAWILSQ